MYGWSSSGEPPSERGMGPESDHDFLSHDGYEFRMMQVFSEEGAKTDRWWVLENATGVAFERTMQEFARPEDTPIQTIERATSEGLGYMLSIHRETPVEKLLPKIPHLIQDCMQCIRESVIPYFEMIREWRSKNSA